MTRFVVTTQVLENYGAHCEDGKFSSGNAYWKFKGGSDYIVHGLDRMQDAMAFVASLTMENNIGFKEFPTTVVTYAEWLLNLPHDEDYREFLMEQAVDVDPRAPQESKEVASEAA